MKVAVLIALLISMSLKSNADYEAIFLPQLITTSDYIVKGKIIKIDADNIHVKIQYQLKGAFADSIITVQKFKNWTCATRFDKYKMEEEAIFFIINRVTTNVIMGAADEGEMPIEKNMIYYQQPDKNSMAYHVYNGVVKGYRYSENDFMDAVKYYLKNYRSMNRALKTNKKYNLPAKRNKVIDKIVEECKL